ncbi:MAG: tyrosine-type recombinase/integrase [Lewinellaceae bacterium]|nr:tyrosine-type recombinase/integrase [Lewinellaceae bacterium]
MKYSNNTVNPHMLRHYYATRMANNGEDIRVVQKLLGHSSQQVTERYLHVDQQRLRQAVRGWNRNGMSCGGCGDGCTSATGAGVPGAAGMTDFHVGKGNWNGCTSCARSG